MIDHNDIVIKEPRWKDKKVLIRSWSLPEPHNRITITAKRKDGTPYYPGSSFMSTQKLKTYPLVKHDHGAFYEVPLDNLLMPGGE
jgi:hypothetical protein